MSFLDNFKTIASNSDAFNNGLDFDLLSKNESFKKHPTLSTIGNLFAMNPTIQKLFGVADPRIYQGIVSQLAKKPYGILGNHKIY